MKPWKAQKFFGDVVYDLRNKGLLPVVILLLIAMVAVPLLISRGSSDPASPSLQPIAVTTASSPETQQAVVTYQPGIRDYKRRLNDLSAKNPFRQQFQQSAAKASKLTSTVSSSASTSSGSSSPSSSSSTETTVNSGGSDSGSTKKKHKVTVTYKANVLAGDVNTTLTPFNDVQAMTPLPSQDTPAVLYYGITADHKKAQFLVSNKVASVNGPGACVPAPDDCALLTLGAGQSQDLVYGGDNKTYRIVVAAIKTVKK